ncbi:MAG TPA: succinylglutamate desuccinylase/aspartoacylase family protein [Alphaproteobacteria bacterium]
MNDLSMPVQLFRFFGAAPGPNLLVLGAVHGDEICGPEAIRQIITEIETGKITITAGSVTFIPVVNVKAYALNSREGDRNLNRVLGPYETEHCFEDRIANFLVNIMKTCDVLLDLHSFKTIGDAFIFVGPNDNTGTLQPFSQADQELRFSQALGIDKMVYGWLGAYDQYVKEQNGFLDLPQNKHLDVERVQPHFGVGTTEYFRSIGGYGVTVECGNHTDPKAIPIACKAIHGALAHLGLTPDTRADIKPFVESYEFSHIFIRHHEDDKFLKNWALFEPVTKGDVLGVRHDGEEVTAPEDGAIIFTSRDAKIGEAWIYFAKNAGRGKA